MSGLDFGFGEPDRLLLLWLLVPVALLLVFARRAAGTAARALLAAPMWARLASTSTTACAVMRGVALAGGLALLLLALAQPRFGFRFEEVKRRGADLVVAVDVSRSMLSADVHPNRLARAKVYVRDLVARLGGDRVGLVAFAGKAVPLCPLTVDHGFFLAALDELSPESAPRGGTAIGDAIRSALTIVGSEARDAERDAALILITDGEDHESFPLEAAAAARERGVKVFTVGIGDPLEGSRVPGKAAGTWLETEGTEVRSKMGEDLLTKIALDTGGAYVPARTGTYDLGQVYEEHLAKLRAADLATEKRRRFVEQFQWFAAAGLALLLLSRLIDPIRRRTASLAAGGMLIAILATSAAPVHAATPSAIETSVETATRVNAAVDALADGRAEEALKDLDAVVAETGSAADSTDASAAALRSPSSPRIALARGAALQRLGKDADAALAYESAAAGADPETTLRARFNLGTLDVEDAKRLLGEKPDEATGKTRDEALAAFDRARDHFRAAIDLDPGHEDARHNLELLRLYVKNLKDAWKRRDEAEAQKKKEEEPFLEQIERLWKEQERLRVAARDLAAAPESEPRRKAASELAVPQRVAADEMPMVRTKLEAALAEQSQAGQAPKQDEAATKQFLAAIDAIGAEMAAAAGNLEAGDPAAAASPQRHAEDGLAGAFLALAHYEALLKRGLELETEIVESLGGGDAAADVDVVADSDPDAPAPDAPEPVALDVDRETTRQRRLDPLATGLVARAEQAIPELESAEEPQLPEGLDEKQQAEAEQQLAKAREQREGLLASAKLAKEKAPAIPPLAVAAGDAIEKIDAATARPKAEEILAILKEIAAPLKQDEQKDQENQDEQDKQDEKDKQDQQEDDPKQQDEKDQQQDEKQPDEKKPDEKKPDEQKGEGEKQEPKKGLTKDQIDQLMRQAQAREKEFDEKKKKALKGLLVPVPVEKDW